MVMVTPPSAMIAISLLPARVARPASARAQCDAAFRRWSGPPACAGVRAGATNAERAMSDAGGGFRPGRLARRLLAMGIVLSALVLGWRNVDFLVGWIALQPDGAIVEIAPDPAYEALAPRYVEVCATSQWRKHVAGAGNPFGHAVMYLKGACMDESAPYPQLRRCARVATDVADPEHGAGVSVGRWFRNVNWVGTPSQTCSTTAGSRRATG
jgi:hypothetical protein